MSEKMWIQSHVERLLQAEWDLCRVELDSDGDIPWRHGTAMGWVSVIDAGDRPMVRVWAHAACGLKSSAKLLKELNDVQLRCTSASIGFAGACVIVSQTVSPIGLTGPVLVQALESVQNVSSDIGSMLAVVYGGETPFPAESPESEDAA